MKIHRTQETVRYFETDRMNVAHHASYLVWFELARTNLLRVSGRTYRDMEDEGYLLPVVEYSCRLMKSVDYEDRLLIETWIEELKSRVITFAYRIVCEDRLIAVGATKHLCVDTDNHYRRVPGFIAETLADYIRE
ncbi:MAG: thioesterase family protein [Candidatus Latescibacterota bacterium]